MAKRKRSTEKSCPCGSGGTYAGCCRSLHDDRAEADTAEALMRARYSAYVRKHEAFLLRSWHPDTRPTEIRFDGGQKWISLDILDTEAGSAFESVGQVEFYARFSEGGIETELHERSTFVRVDSNWVYVDGEIR